MRPQEAPSTTSWETRLAETFALLAKNNFPLFFHLTLVLVFLGLVLLFQMILQHDLYPINKARYFGGDYQPFYIASEAILLGETPYNPGEWGYVSPPPAALANISLAWLSFPMAALIFSWLTFAATVASLFLIYRLFTPQGAGNDALSKAATLLLFMVIVVFSYPFHFLFDRSNQDGILLLLMCAGVLLLWRRTTPTDIAAGCVFAIAASFKLYPLLLIVPLAFMRRWWALGTLVAVLLALILVSFDLWKSWLFDSFLYRIQSFTPRKNSSLASTLFMLGKLLNIGDIKAAAYPLWAAMVAAMAYLDLKKMPQHGQLALAGLLFYLPFMLAIPDKAYHYQLVCVLALLPVVSWLWAENRHRGERKLLLLMTVGLAMTQFQIYMAEKLLHTMPLPEWLGSGCTPRSNDICYSNIIPGIGLIIVMVTCVVYKWRYLYQPPQHADKPLGTQAAAA